MQAPMILCTLLIASASATPCPNSCKCFITNNGIQVANCTDLPDQTTTTWPQKKLQINLESHHESPVMLKNMAFKHFPQLTYLDITGGQIQYVGNRAFDGLPELIELNLIGTGIRKLHRNTFVSNRKLAFLSLKRNPRLFIAPSFLISESITELDLSECTLTTLKSVYFKNLPNLKYLFVMKNKLKSLGSQFGPPGLKYVNLAHNEIESINDNLEAYKRLRTIDLTGNPVNCTCELTEIDKKLIARGVAFGNTITCKNTRKPLSDMVEICFEKEMMGDEPVDIYQADHLLKIDKNSIQSMEEVDDSGSGSGSGDGELFILSNTKPETKTMENNTEIDKNPVEEVIITKTRVSDTLTNPKSSEAPTVEVTSIDPITSSVSTKKETEESTTLPVVEVTVRVEPSIPTISEGNSSTVRSNMDRGIVFQTIKAPENEGDVLQGQVVDYLKSNVGITVTAAILAIVIIAIVYKAVCSGRSRRSNDSTIDNDKVVELKDIKYVAANTEDLPDHQDDSPNSSVEDNLLEDQDDSDDDEIEASPSPESNGHNDLLNSIMGAVENGKSPAPNVASNRQDVPTKVIVKLSETPKASRPITINNVH